MRQSFSERWADSAGRALLARPRLPEVLHAVCLAFAVAGGIVLLANPPWSLLPLRLPMVLLYVLLTAAHLSGFAAWLAGSLRAYGQLTGRLAARIRALESGQAPASEVVSPAQARDERQLEQTGRYAAAHPLLPWLVLLAAAVMAGLFWLGSAGREPEPADVHGLIQGAFVVVIVLSMAGQLSASSALHRTLERRHARIRELEARAEPDAAS